MAPQAHCLVAVLGQQVVDCLDPSWIQVQQRHTAIVSNALHVRKEGGAAAVCLCRNAQPFGEPRRQCRAAADVVRVEQVVLEIDCDEFARVAQFVSVRTAITERIVAAPRPQRLLLPTGEV